MKTLPSPSRLATVMVPPIAAHSSLQMARPRPVPPNRRVVVESACTNFSNSEATRSGAMPIPESATAIRTPASDLDSVAITRPSLRHLRNVRLARLLVASALLGLLTIGDGFLYLGLTERDSLATKYFPLLYVGTNFAYLVLAVPFGRLADRIGRTRVFVGGHVALLLAYLCAGGPFAGAAMSICCLLLLGAYYAATDGVLAAISGRIVHTSIRTSGIATAQTVVAAARFASSLGFGLAWNQLGRAHALWLVSVVLAAAIPAAALLVRGVDKVAST